MFKNFAARDWWPTAHFLAAVMFATTTPSTLAQDSRKVFEQVAPSTVLIEDVDGFGSGVFLNDQGLVLTNYHVVAGNVALKVRARVKFGVRVELTEIAEVKVTKVHKDYDLALLEVKPPPNGRFVAARIIPQAPPLSTGIKCFALGNPSGPSGKALELSITEGLVGAARRKVDGLDYVQISAQINPGNSGGPVCNELGQVFGIATWKLTNTEGLGFAIPTQRLNMADFVAPKDRKTNQALFDKAAHTAAEMLEAAKFAQGPEREELFLAALEAYRVCLLAVPTSARPLADISVVYQRLGRLEETRKYAEAALRRDPNNASACHLLGALTYAAEPNDKHAVAAQCLAILLPGLANTEDDQINSSLCADDLAILMVNEQKWAATAYMVQWADILAVARNPNRYEGSMEEFLRDWERVLTSVAPLDGRVAQRLRIWKLLQEKLPADDLALLRTKSAGFSKEEFEALVEGKPIASAVRITPPVAAMPAAMPSPPASVPVPAKQFTPLAPSIPQGQTARIEKDGAARFASTQIPVPAEGLECPLPDVAGRAVLANAGWQVVISFPDLLKLGVFNLATGRFDGFIDCAYRDPMFSAGGRFLAVCSPSNQTLEVYDLTTLQKIASKIMPEAEPIHFVGMGLMNPTGVFLLQYVQESPGHELFRPSWLTLPGLESTELLPEIVSGNNPLWNWSASLSDALDGGMDQTGTAAAVSRTGDVSPMGLSYFVIHDGNRIDFQYYHETVGIPALAQGGKMVVATRGLRDPASKNRPTPKDDRDTPWLLTPVAGHPAYVNLGPTSAFSLVSMPAMTVVASTPVEAIGGKQLTAQNYQKVIGTMLASAYCDRIICVLPAEKKLVLYPLGLKNGTPNPEPAKSSQ